jgi:hypothetical protein
MATAIREPIQIGVVFKAGVIRPAWFVWRNRKYTVREVTMRWQTAEGRASILHLGVTDGANVYELALNQETLSWWLYAVSASGEA